MKILIISLFTVGTALTLISCEKPGNEQESKLNQLEIKAAKAEERQRQLEAELAQQKLLTEMDAIERERTLIEQDRLAMEDQSNAEKAALEVELEKRKLELAERERRISETQKKLEEKERDLTGLESKLSKREMELAGREPLKALPTIKTEYVSRPTGDFSNFYEPLGAYGSWFNTADYGYVYQPTVVRDISWRPYTRGRWAFTDHGWTWASHEPFGWACYHYGRWSLLRGVGWVWVPGSEWAPAWVTWRESPGHIGWAPLPPETLAWRGRSWDSSVEVSFGIGQSWFSFVSYSNFGNNIQLYCLPVAQYPTFFQSTRNITHYRVNSGRVFCGGPFYKNVCDRIGRPFPVHRLCIDQSPNFGRGGRHLSSCFRGDELQVVAPRMDAEWNGALHPPHVNQDLGTVVVERTGALPEDIRKEFREIRTEEINRAERVVSDAGDRDTFERLRNEKLESGREQDENNLSNKEREEEPSTALGADHEQPQEPALVEILDRPSFHLDRLDRPDGREPIPTLPEAPAINPEKTDPTAEVLRLPDPSTKTDRPVDPTIPLDLISELVVPAPTAVEPTLEPVSDLQDAERPNRPVMPERQVVPETLQTETKTEPPLRTEEPSSNPPPSHPDRPNRPEMPERPEIDNPDETQERAQRQLIEEARRTAAQAELEKARDIREQREAAEKATNEMLERAEEGKSDEAQRMQEGQEQLERTRQQQEQMREQQERARQQQEEQMRRQQEQQEQQERARQQQEQE